MREFQYYNDYFLSSHYNLINVEYGGESKYYNKQSCIELNSSLIPQCVSMHTSVEAVSIIDANIYHVILLGNVEYTVGTDGSFLVNWKSGDVILTGNDLKKVTEEELFQDSVLDDHYSVLITMQQKLLTLKERLYK
ncbi:hypothetical protein [Enterobacter kobei]|uniref:hypothetical protein n=1 Tax=Enterobacter kobei TaxID=208224 RepID=UPI0032AEB4B7